MKRNSSKNPRKKAGFTLVELVVVIAVLAILAGVGVVAYNGYITYAQKGQDRATVGEIMHALELADYSDPSLFGEDGIAVVGLTKTGIKAQGPSGLTGALEDAFGDLASTKLSYDSWEGADLGVLPEITGKTYVKGYLEELRKPDGTASTYTGHFDEVWDEMTKFLTMLHGNSGALPDGITGGADDYLDKIVTYSTGDSANNIKLAWENGAAFEKEGTYALNDNPTVFGARLARNMAFALYAQSRTDIYDPATMGEKLEQFKDNAAANQDVFGEFCFDGDTYETEWKKLLEAYKTSGKAAQDAKAYLGLMQAADEVGKSAEGHLKDTEFLDKMSNYMGMMDGIFSGEIDVSEDTGLGSWSTEGNDVILVTAQKLPNGTLDFTVSPPSATPRTEDSGSTAKPDDGSTCGYGSHSSGTVSLTFTGSPNWTTTDVVTLCSKDSNFKSCTITTSSVNNLAGWKVDSYSVADLVAFDPQTGRLEVIGSTSTSPTEVTITLCSGSPETPFYSTLTFKVIVH